MSRTVIGFKDVVKDREFDYPLLARALKNSEPAHSTKVEWFKDDLNGGVDREFNYTQIVRTPTLDGHLSVIEHVLRFGVRRIYPNHVTSCGGAFDLLRRNVENSDTFSLFILRDLEMFEDDEITEYISEFTLVAYPKVLSLSEA